MRESGSDEKLSKSHLASNSRLGLDAVTNTLWQSVGRRRRGTDEVDNPIPRLLQISLGCEANEAVTSIRKHKIDWLCYNYCTPFCQTAV